MTLTEFLLARIAEDESAARVSGSDAMTGWRWKHYPQDAYEAIQRLALARPKRILAECEAKRRIVEECQGQGDQGPSAAALADIVLCNLAAIYADHPDYREFWRP